MSYKNELIEEITSAVFYDMYPSLGEEGLEKEHYDVVRRTLSLIRKRLDHFDEDMAESLGLMVVLEDTGYSKKSGERILDQKIISKAVSTGFYTRGVDNV